MTGTVYVTWTRFSDTESPIMVRSSTNFGRTFAPAVRVAPSIDNFSGGITPFDQGSNPQVGNDGTLYIAYEASVCDTLNCDSPNDHDASSSRPRRTTGRRSRTSRSRSTSTSRPTRTSAGPR